MNTLTIDQQIEAIKARITDQQAEIDNIRYDMDNFEIEVTDEEYADHLDEIYGTVDVAGQSFDTSRILQELDPTAFRCEKLAYADSLDKEDNADFQELDNQLESMKMKLDDLKNELEELEEGL